MTPILLALALVAQGPLDVQVVRPDGGPQVLLHSMASPLVALRLATPIDPALPEGGAELLQELAREAIEAEAARHGARVAFAVEGPVAVTRVTGPAAAFDVLASLLRRATAEPDLSVGALRRARARAGDRVLARLEQPGPGVRRLLWSALQDVPPPAGPVAPLLDPEDVRRLHAALYHPDRVQVTVVGDLPAALVRSAFARWPHPAARGALLPDPAAEPEPARPHAHREWAGLAYAVDADPATLAVAAELIRQRMAESALRYGAVEPWHGPAGWSLVLLGATEPGDTVVRAAASMSEVPVRAQDGPVAGVARYLRRMVAEAAAVVSPASVGSARTRVRRRLLLEARTVSGRAELIGSLAAASGRTDGGAALLEALGSVELRRVRAVLDVMLERPAIAVGAG